MRPGLLFGEYTDFGKWDQCLAVDQEVDGLRMRGKFCVYELHWRLPESKEVHRSLVRNFTGQWIQNLIIDADSLRFQQISNSICIPSVCSAQEVEQAIQASTSCCLFPLFVSLSFSILPAFPSASTWIPIHI